MNVSQTPFSSFISQTELSTSLSYTEIAEVFLFSTIMKHNYLLAASPGYQMQDDMDLKRNDMILKALAQFPFGKKIAS